MTQTDKEKLQMAKNLVKANNKKIKDLVKDIDSFLVEKGGDDVIDNCDGQTPRSLLEFIKKDLGRLNWDAEEKVATLYLGFLERFEKVLELIDNFEKEGSYTPLPLIREIKEVLEK